MKAQTKTKTKSPRTNNDTDRYAELRRILEDRRRELSAQLQHKIRNVRAEGPADLAQGVVDAEEASVSDIQEDIEIALLQMKSETLNRINEAVARLEEGTYGNCYECGEEISEARLRALPFAVRCIDCEQEREAAAERERFLSSRRGTTAMLMGMTS
jgi:DnaK suppressor protein